MDVPPQNGALEDSSRRARALLESMKEHHERLSGRLNERRKREHGRQPSSRETERHGFVVDKEVNNSTTTRVQPQQSLHQRRGRFNKHIGTMNDSVETRSTAETEESLTSPSSTSSSDCLMLNRSVSIPHAPILYGSRGNLRKSLASPPHVVVDDSGDTTEPKESASPSYVEDSPACRVNSFSLPEVISKQPQRSTGATVVTSKRDSGHVSQLLRQSTLQDNQDASRRKGDAHQISEPVSPKTSPIAADEEPLSPRVLFSESSGVVKTTYVRLNKSFDDASRRAQPNEAVATSKSFDSFLPPPIVPPEEEETSVDAVPVSPTPPPTFEKASKPVAERKLKLMSLQDVEIPGELASIDNRSISTCETSNSGHSQSPAVSLMSRQARRAYIEGLYNDSGRKLRTPSLRRTTGLRRHERTQINRVMVRGRVAVLKPTNQKVFVADENAKNTEDAVSGKVQPKTPERTPKSKSSSPRTRSIEKALLDISVVNNHDKKNELLRRLREDLKKPAVGENSSPIARLDPSPLSSPSKSISSNSDFGVSDDDSSCDFTTSSDTSGCSSSVGATTIDFGSESLAGSHVSGYQSIVSAVTMPPMSPVVPKPVREVHCNNSVSGEVSLLSELKEPQGEESVMTEEDTAVAQKPQPRRKDESGDGVRSKSETSLAKPKLLFITGRAADALCKCNGGHFAIAMASGMTKNKKVRFVRLGAIASQPKLVLLSTDMRCGTQGSLYDIAIRSGCDVRKPYPFRRPQSARSGSRGSSRKRDRQSNSESNNLSSTDLLPARGGLYDTALHSGLTKAALRARTPFSVTTKQRTLMSAVKNRYNGRVIPEVVSDRECGASGTLYMIRGYPEVTLPRYLPKNKRSLYAIKEVEGMEVQW